MGPFRRLVGRSAELPTLDGLLDGAAARRAGAVELVGEPGIGKTRLLAELGRRADARGMLVLSGSASEFERDLPFWVFVDALDEYLAGLPPGRSTSSTPTSAVSSACCSRACHRGPPPRRVTRTSATGPSGPSAGAWRCSRPGRRSSSCSTTCTGPTRGPST